jgi:phthalate 4,5-dioxygenase oxygenase subunit
VLPICHIVPAPAFQFYVFTMPQSDGVTSYFIVGHGDKPIDRDLSIELAGIADPELWNDVDCNFRSSWSNRLGQDRSKLSEDWGGLSGVGVEDWVLAVSMGPILDRTKSTWWRPTGPSCTCGPGCWSRFGATRPARTRSGSGCTTRPSAR